MSKLGLVLSGGGAKGAYQVGVMKALQELGMTQIDAISGASIGALNGAVLASAPSITEGISRLEQLWQKLVEIEPLQQDISFKKKPQPGFTYLTLLASAGLTINTPFLSLLNDVFLDKEIEFSFFSDKPLKDMMDKFLDMEQLQQSIPLYVSVYNRGEDKNIEVLWDIVKAELLGIENKGSEFKHIQSLPESCQKEMLLASAAIPFAFQSRQDFKGSLYLDGGIGGFIRNQGNTPITPLIKDGYEYIIVTHLANGSLWNRYDFPEVKCLEIRPNSKLDMGFLAMFDFSENKIQALQQMGYEDTLEQVGKVHQFMDSLTSMRKASQSLEEKLNTFKNSEDRMKSLLAKLKS